MTNLTAPVNQSLIIANVVGGLGNQMFQYACARALSIELELPLKVTLDMFGSYTSHYGPELERVFALELDVADPIELKRMIGGLRVRPAVRRALVSGYLSPLRSRLFVVEPHYYYWNGLGDRVRKGGYLQGYWQSEHYFSRYATTIRQDFTFRQSANVGNCEIERAIRNSVAVSVHVRRGDYVSNTKALSWHGVCSAEYYLRAMESISHRIPGARFFAFSDDLDWVAETILPRYPDLVLVDKYRGENSYNDMRLMSMCQHHIIANSTFSWWGAWLNPDLNKIVIAPTQWFASGVDDSDLIPSSWERL